MGETHPATRPAMARGITILGLLVLGICVQLLLASRAEASPYTGGFSPTIIAGKADLNGNGAVSGRDDSNEFYGSTDIIDGMLDCDAWGALANDVSPGSGIIDGNDDCSLVGYDGTVNGVTIDVRNGVFQVGNGPLPTVFNQAEPNNPDVGASDFAWSAIGGRVDSNGNETITGTTATSGSSARRRIPASEIRRTAQTFSGIPVETSVGSQCLRTPPTMGLSI